MFKNISKKLGKFFIFTLVTLIILSFVLWGIGDVLDGKTNTYIAKINHEEISLQEFEQRAANDINKYQELMSGFQINEALKEQIKKITLKNLIDKKLLESEASLLGLDVSDEYVANFIAQNAAFKDSDGHFSKDLFQNFLRNIRKSENEYIKLLKSDIITSGLIMPFSSQQVYSDTAVKNLYASLYEKRQFNYVTITNDFIKRVPDPTEVELSQFYNDNKLIFSKPEEREISYVLIDAETLLKDVLSESEIVEEYRARKAAYTPEETRSVLQLLLKDRASAFAAYNKVVKDGFEFGAKQNLSALDKLTRSDLLPELSTVIFNLGIGQISEPVESPLGWHIFKLIKSDNTQFPAFTEVKTDIARELTENLGADYIYKLKIKIEDALAAGSKLEEIAEEYGLVFKRTVITRNADTPQQAGYDDLLASRDFKDAVFGLEENTDSGIQNIDKTNNYFIARVDKIHEARIKALDEVRGIVDIEWRKSQRTKLAKEKLEDLIKLSTEAKNPKSEFKEVLAKANLELKSTNLADQKTLVSSNKNIPATLVAEIFNTTPGKFSKIYRLAKDSYIAAQLIKISQAKIPENSKGLDDIALSLRNEFTDDLLDKYLSYLRTKHTVIINSAAF